MQELIPINEHEFVIYDHETKEYFSMMNIVELSMIVSREMIEMLDSTKREDITMKITTTPTYNQLVHLRKRISKITENDLVEIYIMKDCIKVQIPVRIKTDQIAQIDEIFGTNGIITDARFGDVLIIEYEVNE